MQYLKKLLNFIFFGTSEKTVENPPVNVLNQWQEAKLRTGMGYIPKPPDFEKTYELAVENGRVRAKREAFKKGISVKTYTLPQPDRLTHLNVCATCHDWLEAHRKMYLENSAPAGPDCLTPLDYYDLRTFGKTSSDKTKHKDKCGRCETRYEAQIEKYLDKIFPYPPR